MTCSVRACRFRSFNWAKYLPAEVRGCKSVNKARTAYFSRSQPDCEGTVVDGEAHPCGRIPVSPTRSKGLWEPGCLGPVILDAHGRQSVPYKPCVLHRLRSRLVTNPTLLPIPSHRRTLSSSLSPAVICIFVSRWRTVQAPPARCVTLSPCNLSLESVCETALSVSARTRVQCR